MNFSSLGLAADIVRAVTEHGYTQPTPIQLSAIPAVLEGRDLLAGAQTGTGKTAGFVLPILHQLCQKIAADAPGQRRKVRVLILTPTRELAAQVEESVRVYGKYTPVKSTVVFGGVGMQPQVTRLAQTLDVLVATPGRLLDHIQQRTLRLDTVETLVLDEADRMLDMGFIHDVKRILALLPKKRQNLLFSATFSDDIRELADRLLDRPAEVEVARRNAPAELVEQCVYRVRKEAKRHLLARLIKAGDWHQVLVATDSAARGIDIKELPHVVNYDLPNVPEDYVHRIGRTGRASMSGEAISLVGDDETGMLAGIERLIKRKLPRIELSAEDQAALDSVVRSAGPDLDPRPERPPHRGGRGAGSGNARNRGSNHSRSGNGNGDANGNRMSSRGTQQRFR